MPSRIKNIDQKAIALIDLHGRTARQKVIDEIVRAVRDHDLDTAKHWEAVGKTVDALLGDDAGGR